MSARLNQTFSNLSKDKRAGFIAYMMGGDPERTASQDFLNQMPGAGVDIIELGMPFTDPAADGPVIEKAGLRALAAGTTIVDVLDMAENFRKIDDKTPIILMGYANPVHFMGYEAFAARAAAAGVDGAIIVDLPPEEDGELRTAFAAHEMALIRLATPTTDNARLAVIADNANGFIYYVSVTGITGKAIGKGADIASAVKKVKSVSGLPTAVGFGVKTAEQAREMAQHADAVVVGSAIVQSFHENGPEAALALTRELADAVHSGLR